MQRGIAVITRPEHWERAARHLWGYGLDELARLFLTTPLKTQAASASGQGSLQTHNH